MEKLSPEEITMYEMANDIKFMSAIQDAEKETAQQPNHVHFNFATIPNRVLLIKKLKEAGFKIVKE